MHLEYHQGQLKLLNEPSSCDKVIQGKHGNKRICLLRDSAETTKYQSYSLQDVKSSMRIIYYLLHPWNEKQLKEPIKCDNVVQGKMKGLAELEFNINGGCSNKPIVSHGCGTWSNEATMIMAILRMHGNIVIQQKYCWTKGITTVADL